jgi:hypothetical protein
MSKLVCVECTPSVGNGLGRSPNSPLTGFVGETLERYLRKGHDQVRIPVRFPLLGPGSHVSLIRSDRNPSDPYQVSLEGDLIKKSNLFVLKDRTPVSMYKRVKMCVPSELFEKPTYMSTYSLAKFREMLLNAGDIYPWSWVWKLEKDTIRAANPQSEQHIFIEAKFYGIDAVINTYDANKFRGIAIEVVYRPQPTQEMISKGIRVLRTCTDLLLFSNSDEYISYIDGTTVNRERMPQGVMSQRYGAFITPKIATSLNRFEDHYAKVLEEKNQVASAKVVEKVKRVTGDVPPPNKGDGVRYTYSGAQTNIAATETYSNMMYTTTNNLKITGGS